MLTSEIGEVGNLFSFVLQRGDKYYSVVVAEIVDGDPRVAINRHSTEYEAALWADKVMRLNQRALTINRVYLPDGLEFIPQDVRTRVTTSIREAFYEVRAKKMGIVSTTLQ